ncbi:MAG: Rne/Rng family ribonuclease [Acidobacteria bacterium]|nr:Rne/Rng family ribonuclease [Acidobacteriota bacterium]
MAKEILISSSPHETKVALLEDGQLVEFNVEREREIGLAGSIYKGRVTRVLPGMQSAFVEVGLERDAFLYVSDYFEELEELADTERVELPEPGVSAPGDESQPPAFSAEEARDVEEPTETPSVAEGLAENAEPDADAQPQSLSEAAEPSAAPSDEAEERQPDSNESAPPRFDEDRQPPFLSHEPPLRLPETRPMGGGRPSPRRRHRGGRRRGGRGRPREMQGPMADRSQPQRRPWDRGDRGPRPPREPRQPREFNRPPREFNRPPDEPYEPIILPGESLAKYRDRPAARPSAVAPPIEPETAPTESPEIAAPLAESAPAIEETSQPEFAPAETEAAPLPELAEEPEMEEEPEEDEETAESAADEADEPVAELEDSEEEEPFLPDSVQAESLSEPPAEQPVSGHMESGAYDGAEGPTVAEVEQVRRSQKQTDLPPSVHERTGDGVEWTRQNRVGRPDRGGRDRFNRGGRRRGRGGRGRGGFVRRDRQGRMGRPDRPGGRPSRSHARPSRGQPAIAELLQPGQEIIVQIAKEQMGKKGARITSHITLPGRYLVYMPTINHIGISRKIGTAEERSRLRRLLLELKGQSTGGFVVRTAAAGCSDEDLRQDIDYLVKLWQDLRTHAEQTSAPAVLHRDLDLIERTLRDHLTPEYESIWVDNEEDYAKVLDWVSRYQGTLSNRVKLFTKPEPMFDAMGVQQEIERALRPKVWLKSGGYIVINQTEALVAIDVNTGKFVGKGGTRLEDTIVKTNLEAVQEVVRQIRLRDLGGILIIDFIDMEDSRNRHRVLRALEEELRRDRSPSKLLSFNEFGLVAITRKRTRQSLERVLCQPCPVCTGTGMVKSIETLCLEIQAEARKMAGSMDAPELTIRAHPEIVSALKGKESVLIRELEEQTEKNIILQSDNTFHFEQYTVY